MLRKRLRIPSRNTFCSILCLGPRNKQTKSTGAKNIERKHFPFFFHYEKKKAKIICVKVDR